MVALSAPVIAPISLGRGVVVECPVVLAPMSGVTDAPFRNTVSKLGCGYLVSEMIVSRDTIAFEKNSARKMRGSSNAVQLTGSDPHLMAEAARMCVEAGAKVIDINFGCPARKIVDCYCGAFLMRDEALARKIIGGIVNAVDVPVTVKMRLGWDASNMNAASIAKIAEEEGAAMIAVHARTRAQLYNGSADWRLAKEIRDSISIPMIINGDITSYDAAVTALEESGADGIMIGRAAYGRPWILRDFANFLLNGIRSPEPALHDKRSVIYGHVEDIFSVHGLVTGLGYAKKHTAWYSRGLRNSAAFRARLSTIDSKQELDRLLVEFFVEENVRTCTEAEDVQQLA